MSKTSLESNYENSTEFKEIIKNKKVFTLENLKYSSSSFEENSSKKTLDFINKNDSNSEFEETAILKNFDCFKDSLKLKESLDWRNKRKSESEYQSSEHPSYSKKVSSKMKRYFK